MMHAFNQIERSGSHLRAPGRLLAGLPGKPNTPTGTLTLDRDAGCNGRDALCVNAGRNGVGIPPANFAPVAVFSLDHGC